MAMPAPRSMKQEKDLSSAEKALLSIDQIEKLSPQTLKPNIRNARTHSKKQIKQIAESIQNFGFNNPILVDDENAVIAGHGRLEAAKRLGLKEVPVVRLSHLSDTEKRAYVLADNKIALNSGWDSELLSLELGELVDLLPETDFELEITGFETAEIDLILLDNEDAAPSSNGVDEISSLPDVFVAKRGDIWQLGKHRLLCGDARDPGAAAELFAGSVGHAVITDPPYNVKVQGHVGGRGKIKHEEFAFASGEMSDDEFKAFLHDSIEIMQAHCKVGALLYLFMDWRHIEMLLSAGRGLGLTLKNICVWNKTTPGQGSFYRSAHEMVAVFAKPGASSVNNVQLGKFGRNRTNVWSYPGVNTFQSANGGELALHPTVKPVAMIAEAIKDATRQQEIVFDPFVGSGTTLLAAEKVGRLCYGVEYAAKYIDIAIRRWQQLTGKDAVLVHRLNEYEISSPAERSCFNELSERIAENSEVAQ